jgi:hypothetical protein
MTPELLAALKVLLKENLGDWIYDVRSRAGESGDGFTGNSWHHPRVKAFSDAVTVIEKAVKEAEAA